MLSILDVFWLSGSKIGNYFGQPDFGLNWFWLIPKWMSILDVFWMRYSKIGNNFGFIWLRLVPKLTSILDEYWGYFGWIVQKLVVNLVNSDFGSNWYGFQNECQFWMNFGWVVQKLVIILVSPNFGLNNSKMNVNFGCILDK